MWRSRNFACVFCIVYHEVPWCQSEIPICIIYYILRCTNAVSFGKIQDVALQRNNLSIESVFLGSFVFLESEQSLVTIHVECEPHHYVQKLWAADHYSHWTSDINIANSLNSWAASCFPLALICWLVSASLHLSFELLRVQQTSVCWNSLLSLLVEYLRGSRLGGWLERSSGFSAAASLHGKS